MGTIRVEELSHNPLTDRVIRSIQDLILRGDVAPGEYLPPQPELAARFGVGLSTIREAVKALSLVGLLEAQAGRGTRVLPDALKVFQSDMAMKATLGPLTADAVWEARQVLEVALTRMAAERATAADMAAIESAFSEMSSAVEDEKAFVHADLRFHLAIAHASQNPVLTQTYYLISNLLETTIELADALPGGRDRAIANHAQILEGIRTRDPGLAQAAVERQLSDVTTYGNAVPSKLAG